MVPKWKGVKTLLIGEYEHSLDAKGRLIMPAKFREDIGEKFFLDFSSLVLLIVKSINKVDF